MRVLAAVARVAVGAELLLRDDAGVAGVAVRASRAARAARSARRGRGRTWPASTHSCRGTSRTPRRSDSHASPPCDGNPRSRAAAGPSGSPWRGNSCSRAGVRAGEREAGLRRVIETRRLPAGDAVAAAAVRPASAAVHVVGRVARRALCRGARVAIAAVTGRAGHLGVALAQREAGLAVIEAALRPGGRLVAAAAVRAELAGVRLVGPVAVDAARRRLAVLAARLVAGVASARRVRAGQREIGPGVIERRPAQLDDVGVAPEVLGVAGLALRTVDRRAAGRGSRAVRGRPRRRPRGSPCTASAAGRGRRGRGTACSPARSRRAPQRPCRASAGSRGRPHACARPP